MKKNVFIIIVSTFVLILMLWFVMKENIGISEKNIESDARWSQNIPPDWNMTQSLGNGVVAMVFFPYDNSDCVYSIYIKRSGLYWGYFFRAGGTISKIEELIVSFIVEGYDEIVYLSGNKQNVTSIVVDDGSNKNSFAIDYEEPFVFVLPNNAGNVQFYDIDGEIIECVQRTLPN